MKDWNSAIVTAYMATLTGAGINTYNGIVPDSETPGNKYVVINAISAVENSDKNSFDGNISVLLDIITIGEAVLNYSDSWSMANTIKGLINSKANPDLSPDFYCSLTSLPSETEFIQSTVNQKVLRRLIRFEHFIGQIT